MQGGGDLADHLEADEEAQHEDRYVGEQFGSHWVVPPAERVRPSGSRAAVAGWITSPPWVMTTPAWMSSAGSMARAPSVTMCSSSELTFRANAAEAAPGTVAARFPAPTRVTPFSVTPV